MREREGLGRRLGEDGDREITESSKFFFHQHKANLKSIYGSAENEYEHIIFTCNVFEQKISSFP